MKRPKGLMNSDKQIRYSIRIYCSHPGCESILPTLRTTHDAAWDVAHEYGWRSQKEYDRFSGENETRWYCAEHASEHLT